MRVIKSARFVHMSASERKLKAKWQRQHKPPAKVGASKSGKDVAAIAAAIRARGQTT